MVTCVKVEVFSAKEVEIAAAMSYMTKGRGSMGTISRRNTIDSSGSRTSVGIVLPDVELQSIPSEVIHHAI